MRHDDPQLIMFDDLDAVPPGVQLCHNDRCTEQGLHAEHKVHRKGATAKTYICNKCQRTAKLGVRCGCQKEGST